MKNMKILFTLMIISLILPICFASTFEKQMPNQIEEPDVVSAEITIQTDGYKQLTLVEMFPVNTEILTWDSNVSVDIQTANQEFDYFGNVTLYIWDFKEIEEETIKLTYTVNITEYGEFKTTTVLAYPEGVTSPLVHRTNVGEVHRFSAFEGTNWQLIALLTATIIMVSGIIYRFYKKYYLDKNKKQKKQPKKPNKKATKTKKSQKTTKTAKQKNKKSKDKTKVFYKESIKKLKDIQKEIKKI